MTKRKSLFEKILHISYCVITTGVTICVLFLFLIQPEGVWDILTSTHAVGLFGFAAGAIISCIVTTAILYIHFSKKIESKNKCIRNLVEDRKQLRAQLRNMPRVEEKVKVVDETPSKPKNILGAIAGAFSEYDDDGKEDSNTQDETSADES